MSNIIKSPIKYAGAKGWLLPYLENKLPQHISTFVDFFSGSLVVPMNVKADRIIANDINRSLINMYKQIKDNKELVVESLASLQKTYNEYVDISEKEAMYYNIRNMYNKCLEERSNTPVEAALLIFLNKAGFNGVYRTNKKGLFNVPWGKKDKINCFDSENIDAISLKLNDIELVCGDFEDAISIEELDSESVAMIDSPYVETFVGYQGGFGMNEHERVAALCDRLDAAGIKFIATNSTAQWVLDRYNKYHIEIVNVRRSINRNADGRTGQEVIITNF